MKRRQVLGAALAIAMGATLSPVAAQTYPERPVTLVVPFAAGGSTDLVARTIAQKMSTILGQQVLVDNKGGAGGNLGASFVAKAPADGYTILMGTIATHALVASLYAKPPFDPVKDFAPIAWLVTVPNVLTVNKDYPAQNVQELIARLKEKPGEEVYSSSGNGTPLHLSGELFKSLAGVDMVHVPYQGSGPALVDAVSGAVPINFDNLPSSTEFIRSGALRALAVTTKTRAANFPDIPTMEEAGVPGYETNTWNAFFAPAGTPPEVIATLNRVANEAIGDAAVKARLAEVGATTVGGTPEELAAHVQSEITRWRPVIEKSGARIE
ncbi:Bug family tripartite tricarboxylate transporter substrate binding protein [Aureimonas jatrophae]|uniref:Tripartite-type tricarboxylate transporter, receptor component TctC n=1 Tax=Aureimonas jatrophae TaxID=1166073 RepID=A0A1H0IPQ1_9HYPH|nr:tripartite tricarboxylate transporter substrate binding protein [Aureimonas jatrophae]MBB3952294.1 tripartite-type tricarboxylate transporter receptor subunit TctC [Aureimonas jatrophae]SDO33454.1 Tripartite-type tricarboxylate transporter, receptor component TctC [Aureimonas jatrophae]